MNEDLKIIKNKYGEKMMHLCRIFFPTLLETPGLLSNLLLSNFDPSRFLYDDIINNNCDMKFKDYIYSLVVKEKRTNLESQKAPKELLNEAGYDLFECYTEEDIQSFRKYYAPKETLCTFKGGRLNHCHVFFAIKKNVDEIKREDFKNPMRQDLYGTSVISIQFARGDVNTLSIKNRYNHIVDNPDATFSNDLDNIIVGLTESFEKEYGLNLQNEKNKFELPGYVRATDGKFYKYNYEINNVYYCPNNIIIDNFEVINTYKESEKYIVLDYFILDLVTKKIVLYDQKIEDSFIDTIPSIDKINITKSKETGNKIIEILSESDQIIIEVDKTNKIVKYCNNSVKEIKDSFMYYNNSLNGLELSNVSKVDDYFLYMNTALEKLNLPELVEIGAYFLNSNKDLEKLNLPNLIKVGNFFLYNNQKLIDLDLPKLTKVGLYFLATNNTIQTLNLPKLTKIGAWFLDYNKSLKSLNIPKLPNSEISLLDNKYITNLLSTQNIEETDKNKFLSTILKITKSSSTLSKKILEINYKIKEFNKNLDKKGRNK